VRLHKPDVTGGGTEEPEMMVLLAELEDEAQHEAHQDEGK